MLPGPERPLPAGCFHDRRSRPVWHVGRGTLGFSFLLGSGALPGWFAGGGVGEGSYNGNFRTNTLFPLKSATTHEDLFLRFQRVSGNTQC